MDTFEHGGPDHPRRWHNAWQRLLSSAHLGFLTVSFSRHSTGDKSTQSEEGGQKNKRLASKKQLWLPLRLKGGGTS
eukprot:5365462-Amphidinium_carterae.2